METHLFLCWNEIYDVLAFIHSAMLFLAMHLQFSLQCNVVVGDGHVLMSSFMIDERLECVTFPW